jgi:tetratricopeptide (TPR) repeat protein
MSDSYLSKGLALVSKAVEYDGIGKFEEALSHYKESLIHFKAAAQCDPDEDRKALILEKSKMYANRVEELEKMLQVSQSQVIPTKEEKHIDAATVPPQNTTSSTKEIPSASIVSPSSTLTSSTITSSTTATSPSTASSTEPLQKGLEVLKRAIDADSNQDFQEAFRLYKEGLDYLLVAQKHEKNEKIRATIRSKMATYMDRAEELQKLVQSTPLDEKTKLQKLLAEKDAQIRALVEENRKLKALVSQGNNSALTEANKQLKSDLDAARQKIEELELVWEMIQKVHPGESSDPKSNKK